MPLNKAVKVAVPQWEPVWLDAKATTEKAIGIVDEAAKNGAKLVVFGELSIPGYPTFLYGGRMNDVSDHAVRFNNNAIEIDGPEINAFRFAAKRNNIIVHVGFVEKEGKSLYMGNAIIDEHGEIILHRRKIKPSHYERTLFGEGGPESATNCVETSIGRISVLNCWEHFQPLLKYHTYSQQPYIHIAAWPLLHPWGGREQWAHSAESGTAVTRTVAVESGAFVLTASNVISEAGMQTNAIKGLTVEAKEGESAAGHIKPGGGLTAIYAPDGRQISAEIADDVETIVYADLDPDMVPFAALCQDTVGHYSRPDMFQLIVKSAPAPRVVYQQPDGTVRGPPSRIKPFAQLQADASAAHSIRGTTADLIRPDWL